MLRIRSLLFFLVIFLAGLGSLAAQKLPPQSRQPRLIPGVPVQGVVELGPRRESVDRYRLAIPENAYAVEFEITESSADLDLLLYDDSGELFVYSEEDVFNESFVLTRLGEPALFAGEFELEVAYQWSRPPVVRGELRDEIPYTLTMRFVIPDGSRRLTLDGRPAQGSLELTGAMLQAFEVQVPRGAPQIRIDLTGATGDLDLYAFVGGVQSDPYLAEYHSVGGGTAEWLVLNSAEDATAVYGIVVLSWLDEVPVDFTIQAKTGADPPADLLGYPTIPVPPAGIGRSLISTVEVLDDFGGGSACLLTPDGWLITNHHVIANSWEDDRLVRIALSLDHSLAPRELFLARIVDVRKDADLALLKIESGLYGQDLPRDMRLPYFSVESDSGLSIGQDIRIIGYPSIGALGTRSTITLTRGLVSGFEQRGFGRVIKTDGEINSGNSGGAAVTESGLLVGFPTWVISEGGGQLAYVSPVGAVPEDWWQRMGLGLP